MKKTNKRSSLITGLLFSLAIVLLGVSTVGSTRAALQYESEIIVSEFRMREIGIDITDGSETIPKFQGTILAKANKETDKQGIVDYMLGGTKFVPGKLYKRNVYIANTGNIDEYMRVSVHKYWIDKDGKPTDQLDPSLIKLTYAGGWVKDTDKCTDECDVFIYTPSAPVPSDHILLMTSLQVDDSILAMVEQETVKGETTTTYVYDGAQVCLEIEADGVQTHNAADAIKSAWGNRVSPEDPEGATISLG